MTDDKFLTAKEVVKCLHVNLRTVYRLIQTGEIPAVRVGRLWRFRKTEIDAWVAKQHAERVWAMTEPSAGDDATAPTRGTSRPRVLVVDDEPNIRDVLSKALALADYDVDVAPDGTSAL